MDIENIEAKVATAALVELCREAIKGVKSLASYLAKGTEQHDLLGDSIKAYTAHLADRFSGVKILGMSAPVPLEQIYTRVKVRDRIQKTQTWIGALTKESYSDLRSRDVIIQAIDVINNTQYVAILGQPGAGKTTFLRHILLQALQGKLHRPAIPIFVSLNDISVKEKTSVFSAIVSQFATCFLADAEEFVENLLRKGRCMLLLDGLDEVSNVHRTDVIRDIIGMSQIYPSNRFVVSCRVAAYNHWFDSFSDFEVADFSNRDIETFVKSWFLKTPQLAASCIEQLRTEPSINALASLPLFLVMICLAFEDTKSIATTRVELYRSAIDALLVKWDSTRSISRDEQYKQLTLSRKLDLFAEIASDTFEAEEYYFRSERVGNIIEEFLKMLPGIGDIDGGIILESIEANHGLLVERANKIHSFSHLTFQEYFTARYYLQAGPDAQNSIVEEHGADPRWREVIILLGNILPNADILMLALLRKLTALGYPPYQRRIVEDADDTIRFSKRRAYRPGKSASVRRISVVPSIRTVQKAVMQRSQSLGLDALLRGLGTKILVEFILSEGAKQVIRDEEGISSVGNEKAKLFALAIMLETATLVSYEAGFRAQLRSDMQVTGRYYDFFRQNQWVRIVRQRLDYPSALRLIDILPRQQAGELAAELGEESREVIAYSEGAEYLSSLLESSRQIFEHLGLEAPDDKQRSFVKTANRTLGKSGTDAGSIRGWRQAYLSGIILDMLLGQVILHSAVREAALVVLEN